MWYAINCKDKENSLQLRIKTRESHLERLNELSLEGRILVAGPNPMIDNENPGDHGFSGSLIIAEFDSLNEAQEWADNDPYNIAGVFESIEVKPFKRVLP